MAKIINIDFQKKLSDALRSNLLRRKKKILSSSFNNKQQVLKTEKRE
ncbi:hypothetical protein CAXC1_350023 [Candidatus Xenohaliotis californiensis]|uniref:Uncharacterized protein n=1 Tax=Candidatus Xenohaliotis californiensis TaxID=84677 RepID=A0ABM9N8S1_9RICK|nr:hypothetical protein CAXC1_350023 [Candidatus Xenohaliotis californiensis]